MNRKERRKQGIKQPPPSMKHITVDHYNKALDDAYKQGHQKGVEQAFIFMMAIPLITLHDHYKEVMRREWQGISRTEHFFDLCAELFDHYNSSEGSVTEMCNELLKKTGFDITAKVFEGK